MALPSDCETRQVGDNAALTIVIGQQHFEESVAPIEEIARDLKMVGVLVVDPLQATRN